MVAKRTTIAAILVILVVTSVLFTYTVQGRRPWFGQLSKEGHSWATASTLKYVRNWCREGALNTRFGVFQNPPSVEFRTWEERFVDSSFLPGPIIPLYLSWKLSGREPTPETVMALNLANHFTLAFLCALLVLAFLFSIDWPPIPATVLALVPVPFVLLLPLPYYALQNVYCADEPALVPFALAILLELLRDGTESPARRRALSIMLGATTLCGMLINWTLFMPFGAVLFLKRLTLGEMGTTARERAQRLFAFALPYLLPLSFLALQLWALGGLPRLVDRFFQRTGIDTADSRYVSEFTRIFWGQHVTDGFGSWAPYCILAGGIVLGGLLLFAAIRRISGKSADGTTRRFGVLLWLMLIPCLLKVYLLREHSAVHYTAALAFVILFATTTFALLPALVVELLGNVFPAFGAWFRQRGVAVVMSCGLLVAATGLAIHEHPRAKDYFPPPEPDYERVGTFIDQHTRYNDIVFSPGFRIPFDPPQYVCYSMKRVYDIASLFDIYELTHTIGEDYAVNLFSRADSDFGEAHGLERLLEQSEVVAQSGEMKLRRISKEAFLSLCQSAGVTSSDEWDVSRNLLVNGNFELGDDGLEGWTPDLTPPDVRIAREAGKDASDGAACLRIEYTERDDEHKIILIQQVVKLESPGGLYGVRFRIKRKYVGSWLGVSVIDAAPQGYKNLYHSHFIHPHFRGEEWLPISFVVDVPPQTKALRFELRRPAQLYPSGRTATIRLDDCCLIPLADL